ncbi:hypothetical protein B0H13DRAFT_2672349 [Mycena leptocephala]|nr:hypothetical protein B0H13DRAFT_2672349 [Mycena leptocephala]
MAPARGPDSARQVTFTLSGPSSVASSRTASPAPTPPTSLREEYLLEKVALDDPGCRPMDVYDATLPAWRAAVRRVLVAQIRIESVLVAKMQDAIRTPFLDKYFVHTSALGSHTFFMTFLPMLFFFGYPELGRGLIVVLCLGIYFTSVAKDLFCSPRPFAPPVTRMTIGTHHLEYGMPSTHSANSVSLALFFFAHIHELAFPSTPTPRRSPSLHTPRSPPASRWFSLTIPLPSALAAAPYTYTATLFPGWGWGAFLETWILRTPSSLHVPLTLIPLALLAVNQHPQPVDDCPCFEDAIAIGSVMLGSLVGRWGAVRWGAHVPGAGVVMPGCGWVLTADGWEAVERSWGDVGVWWAAATAKMVFGILAIFVWRLIAKAALHRALPPTFRFLATLMRLPNRRFYTPATDYTSVPPVGALRPIPSVIDLPSTAGVEPTAAGEGRAAQARGGGGGSARRGAHVLESEAVFDEGEGEEVKHYDADVLTKLIVYAGIAVIACEVMPVLFEKFGWGVRSWP